MAEIYNQVSNTLVTGTEDADSITNHGNQVTLAGLGGDDLIDPGADEVVVHYSTGDGNDTILNVSGNTTLAVSGMYTSMISGAAVVLTVGDGKISLPGAANLGDNLHIQGPLTLPGGNVTNRVAGVVIEGLETRDSVDNHAARVTVHGNGGNDYLWNEGSEVSIDGGADNDTIYSGSTQVTVSGGAGNDYLHSRDNYSTIDGGAGNDTIYVGDIANGGENNIIYGGDGDDSIRDLGSDNFIDGGAGDDTIDGNYHGTIQGGTGNDSIYVNHSTVVYALGDGNDTVEYFYTSDDYALSISGGTYSTNISGQDVVVTVGEGKIILKDTASIAPYLNIIGTPESGSANPSLIVGSDNADTIFNSLTGATISALGAADSVYNEGYNVSISGGTGNDTIYNRGDNVTMDGDAGNDYLYNRNGDSLVMNGGDGADTIVIYESTSYGRYITINGGAGNDTIFGGYKSLTTISGGAGNDSVDELAGVYVYNAGDGNDVITSYASSNAIISIVGSTYTSTTSGDDVVLNVGTGSIRLVNANAEGYAMPRVIADTTPSDTGVTVDNTTSGTLLTGTAYGDSITNSGSNVTIAAGAGNDTIENTGDNVRIDAGAGNDSVYSHCEDVTISGAGGNDTIVIGGDNHLVNYASGDGNDLIQGFKTNSTLSITGAAYTSVASGSNIILGVGNGSVTLEGAASLSTVNIIGTLDGGGTGATIDNTVDDTLITGTAYADSITNSGDDVTINAAAGNDTISLSSSATGNVIQYASGDGNDTVIGFNDTDTLSVGDNAYATQVSGNDLIITVGTGKITLVDAASLSNPNIESTNEAVNLLEILLKRTAAGYPIASGILLNPEELIGEEPDNYATKEDWIITSVDNLKLHGICYTPENSNDKWVVLVHGYGLKLESMYPFATFYLANDYNVLMIDQRAAGESEGTWLTMGAAESQDVALWTQEIARRNSDAKITLHGVSMGSATAMLAAARSDAVNVTALIEDCGYTSAMKLFYLINKTYSLGFSDEVVAALDSVGHGMMGYYLHDAAPIDSISSAKMPTLFISGDDDGVVPVSMLSELYDASGAEVKEKFIVKGAGHAQAGLNDPVGYSNSVFRFVAEANGEGWATENIADNISLRGTKYNDTLANSGDYVTINAGAGNDTIENTGDSVSIYAGPGNDFVYSHCEDVTISGAGGNDTIVIGGDNHLVDYASGDGNDYITGFNDTSTISISGAAYTSVTSGSNIILGVGDGSVTLEGAADLSTVNIIGTLDGGSTPADTGVDITNTTSNTVITGTAYADTITNRASNVTINAQGGDDIITNNYTTSPDNVLINGGAGNDTIENAGDNSTVQGGAGDDSISNFMSTGAILGGGAGNDTIENYGNRASISGGAGNDFLGNYRNGSTVLGGDGADTIENAGDNSTIQGGAGNDSISNVMSTGAILDGGAGNDTVENYGESASISGGTGNDTLTNIGNNAFISGGAGADLISLGSSATGNVIQYASGDGNDTVSGLGTTDTISITGAAYTSVTSGSNIILGVGNGSVTLEGAVSLDTLNIVGTLEGGDEPGDTLNNTVGNTLITGTPYADSIRNTGASVTIQALGGNDTITSNGNHVSIGAASGNDTITFTGQDVTINAGTGNDTLRRSAFGSGNALIEYNAGDGNDYIHYPTSNDTLSIAGAAYSSIESDEDLILVVEDNFITLRGAADRTINIIGEYTDSVKPGEYIINRQSNITITGTPLADTISNYGNYVTIQALASQDSIRNYGNRVSISGGTGDDYIDNYSSLVTIEGDSGNDTINNISGNYVTIRADAGNDSVNNGGNYVTIRADAGDDTIINGGDNVVFVCHARNGGNDLIQGFKANSTLSIVADGYNSGSFTSVQSGNDIVLTFISGGNTVTLQGAATLSTVNIFGGGEVGISVNNTVNNTIVTGTDCADTLTNSGNYVTINAGKDNDTISNIGENSAVDADDGNDTIYNGGDNTSINGGAGNDSIMSDGGGMTITGGKGDDTINSSRFGGVGTTYRYTSGDGNDFIQNFENEDTLVVIGSDFTTTRAHEAVVVVTVGEGKITLLGAEGTPNIISESAPGLEIHNTTNNTIITGSDYDDTITNTGTRVTLKALDGDDYIANVVDSSVTAASLGNSISAGDGNDTIYNSHSYNPTLEGGAGDDSIVVNRGHMTYIDGGAGADTILGQLNDTVTNDWHMGGYATILGGEGNDYIAPGYANDSSISGGAGNDTIITNGENSTIDGGAGNNLIQLTTVEGGDTPQYIIFNGNTTVEGFGTGFGDNSDTIYAESAPNVDFKGGGLTFYSSDKSLTLSDVTTTAKVNLYNEAEDKLSHGVFIPDNTWHNATRAELATDNLYYVGATASKNHGVNFDLIRTPLSVTLDTDYNADSDFYVNNVYSIRGGAGNTTITGSKKSDTIIAGTGATTINAGAGGDILSGNGKTTFNIDSGATAIVNGSAGDSLNVGDDSLTFLTDGTVYIVNGKLRRVSDSTIIESEDGDVISGSGVKNATVIDGTSESLTANDRELVIGKRGASLKGYTLDKTFIRNELDAATIIDLINATDASQLVLDAGTFYTKNQSPIVLEDYDTSDGTFVNIKTADGRKTIFGWSPLNGGIVDGNSIDKPQVLFGDAPNGNSTIRGGALNDSIYAGAKDVVSLSGGHDELHINDETSHGVTVDMGDGSAQSRTRIVEGFDVTRDLLQIDSPENINTRILDGSLQFIKGDSRVTFDELATFDDANGLQVQVDGRTYELRNDYDSGLKDVDYFWTDTDGNYFLTDSTFRIFDDGSTREYFIAEGSGKLTIDGFNFGRDNDKLNVSSIDGLTASGDNLYVTSGDSDIVEVTGGAGKTIDINLDGTTYTAQLGKHLTYDLAAEYYGDLHGGTGNAISVGSNFAQEEVAIYLNEEEEADGKVRYYGGVTKIDASKFDGQASLVGSEFNDQIIAAQGATSLWGGESGDDELFGTGTDNSFFYCLGNGDDKIYNAADGDEVNLVDITLEDITNSIISDGAVTLELSDGGRLTVMNSADVTFNLGDGTSWKADRQSKEWTQQA